MTAKIRCKELDLLQRAAASAILEAKRIRLSRDVSIYEDAELSREGHRRIYTLLSICSSDMMAAHAPPPTDPS
jgi:hypothetical protein